jgi:hypothetical protein
MIREGLIGFSTGDSTLSKTIRKAQSIWVNLYSNKDEGKPIMNHVFMTVKRFGKIYVIEADLKVVNVNGKYKWKPVVKMTKWEQTEYARGKVEYCFKEPIKPWSKEELLQLSELAEKYEGRPYEKVNVAFHQVIKTFTNRWIGKTGLTAELAFICCELVGTMCHNVRNYWFPNCAELNVMELYLDNDLKDANV